MTFESLEHLPDLSLYNIEGVKCPELSKEELRRDCNELDVSLKEINPSFEGIYSGIEKPEVLTDIEMKVKIADYLETVSELRFENWNRLTLQERLEVLNKVEQNIAYLEHRPALRVDLERLEPRNLGYQSSNFHKIVLNTLYVESNNPHVHRQVVETIIHEGRHAYQHYNVDVKLIHESSSEVLTWAENFYNPKYQYYRSGTQKIFIPYNDGSIHDVDFRLYYYQPVEIDARNFADDVLSKLEITGLVCRK